MGTGAAGLLTAPRSLSRLACLGIVALALGFNAEPAPAADPVIAAAGDIACSPSSDHFNGGNGTSTRCRQKRTSDLLVGAGLSAVLTLADNQYHTARLSSFQRSYHPSWGRVKAITRPSAGNHEYKTAGAAGYFDYFNGAGRFTGPAGDRDKGYYSFDVGTWHVIALNSSDHCSIVSCASGSAQQRWLRADLAAHPASCTLAYWHHPRFNSGHDGNATFIQPLFSDLYDAGVDVVLGGHAHHYERFAPQNPDGKLDRARGIQQFVVGTGGSFFTSIGSPKPNSLVRQNNTYGVLFLTLRPTSYDWRFVSEAGRSFTDAGSGACHDLVPPTAPDSTGPEGAPEGGAAPRSPATAACDLLGTLGDDTITGTARGETICGLAGDDVIRGGGGDDLILGGAGRDRMRGNDGRDRLRGGRGPDTLFGGRGKDVLHGNLGNDRLTGHSGDDRLIGHGGRNRLFGNAGDDALIADRNRRGVDLVHGGRGRDTARIDRGDRVRRVERIR